MDISFSNPRCFRCCVFYFSGRCFFFVDFSSDPTRDIIELTCYIWSHRSRAINYCFLHRYNDKQDLAYIYIYNTWHVFETHDLISVTQVTQNFFLTQSCQPFSWNKARKVSEKIGCLWAAQRTSAFAKKRIMHNLNLNKHFLDGCFTPSIKGLLKGARLFPTKINPFVLARIG